MDAGDIDSLARRWVILEDKGALSAEDEAALRSWLDADPRHLGAHVRAQAAWGLLARARVLEAPAAPRRTAPGRIAASVAAAACLAAGLGAAMMLRPAIYASDDGQIRRVALPDGSVAVLDAATRVRTWIHLGRRDITVERGEAWFQVAHDPTRPFIVSAGHSAIRAVGTAFSVTRTEAGADVIVTQGVVAASPDRAQPMVPISAGTKAVLNGGAVRLQALTPQDLGGELAWREGRIALNGAPLRDAIARFNRYNARKLVLASPELGDISTVGWFSATDPESFARAVAAGLHARIDLSNGAITISRATEKTDSG